MPEQVRPTLPVCLYRNAIARSLAAVGLFLVQAAILLAPTAWAQEGAPAAGGSSPTAAEAKQEFDDVFKQWKEKLKEIRTLQVEFQSAAPAEKKAMQEQFDQLVAAARALLPDLKRTAEAAYRAAPDNNAEVAGFLASLLADQMTQNRYPEALRLATLLEENKTENPRVDLLGGVAAFIEGEYQLAKTWLTKAREAGALGGPPASGAGPFEQQLVNLGTTYLSEIDNYIKISKEEQEIRAAEAKADDLPRVKFETSKGDIVLELFENEAPIAVANFVNLVGKKFYDGLTFHRVLPLFMAQGGCPKGTGSGGPGYTIPCECHEENHRRHFAGSLSMAHAGRDTGGSQFFLTFVPTPHLNGRHTVFGRVIEGMDVLRQLQLVDPARPGQPRDKIVKATILRKRDHVYEPKKSG